MKESFEYRPENAEAYESLGIEGTTFEMSYQETERTLGDLSGKTVLDFGSGAGRSTNFLKTLGAEQVIGVDRNRNMIQKAKAKETEGVHYLLAKDDELPIQNQSLDIAFASQVFMEMKSKDAMIVAMSEINRTLKPSGKFVLIVTNPEAYGHDFKNYYYPDKREGLNSGDVVQCVIKGDNSFAITDYFWTEEDYKEVLEASGFEIEEMAYPLPKSGEWLDETQVPPDIVMSARKKMLV